MPLVRKSSARAALAVVPMALAVMLGTAGTAHATFEEDSRATVVHADNVDAGQKDACEKAGLAGTPLAQDDLEFTGGEPDTDKYLTITGLADGVSLSGIVVKGGNGYNVYVPGEKGLSDALPWTDLRSPLNKGGNIPTISHWFACGTVTVPTTTSSSSVPTTDSSTTTPPESTSSTEPTESTTGTSGESSTPASSSAANGGNATTTTSAPVVVENASDNDDLASTGFGSGWLLWVGALLVLGGAAVLVLLRIRRNA